jgi:hypothetical protein
MQVPGNGVRRLNLVLIYPSWTSSERLIGRKLAGKWDYLNLRMYKKPLANASGTKDL